MIFIIPEFSLFQAPLNKPFILPTQLRRYLEKLESSSAKLNGSHRILADKLVSLHLAKSPYTQVPFYEYEKLKKGITCTKCNSFSVVVERRSCFCNDCGNVEKINNAILRSVEEFKYLFPNRKVTTSTIYEWCGEIVSKKWIGGVLGKNYKMIGSRQWAYYE